MRLLILMLLFGSLGGCATNTPTLWVYSQPQGAYITELGTGRVAGMAPAASVYNLAALEPYKDKDGCYRIKGFEARWVSGARSTSADPMRLCGKEDSYNITISRDSSYPDLEKDLQFALQIQSIIAQQQQARAARQAANAALFSAYSAAQRANTPPPPTISSPVHCTTNSYGGTTVYTTCQ